jgi:hypothetical protein
MDKKLVIEEVIKLADKFENKGMISIANRVTDIAVRLAYDFNNPRKEEVVDQSLALEDNPVDSKGSSHWYDDDVDDDDRDDSDKVDFSNIFKELLVDDSLTKDFAFEEDEEEDEEDEDDEDEKSFDDESTSFDKENEGHDEDEIDDVLNEDSWNELFHNFIKDGDISRSQIEDALAVVLSKNKEFRDKTSAVLKYMTKTSEKTNKVMKLSQALSDMNKMFGKDIKVLH